MPYDRLSELPDWVKEKPVSVQQAWRDSFNSAHASFDPGKKRKKGQAKTREEYAFRVASAAIQHEGMVTGIARDVLLEYNQFHDERGRFSSSGGAKESDSGPPVLRGVPTNKSPDRGVVVSRRVLRRLLDSEGGEPDKGNPNHVKAWAYAEKALKSGGERELRKAMGRVMSAAGGEPGGSPSQRNAWAAAKRDRLKEK